MKVYVFYQYLMGHIYPCIITDCKNGAAWGGII